MVEVGKREGQGDDGGRGEIKVEVTLEREKRGDGQKCLKEEIKLSKEE